MQQKLSFRFQILLRIAWVLLAGFSALFVAIKYPAYYLLIGWFVLFGMVGVVGLIRYIERAHRAMSQFLISIQQNDFSTSYSSDQKLPDHLMQAFRTITESFIELRSEKESNYHFLKTIVEHSGVPLIAYQENSQKLLLINKAAVKLLNIPHITQLKTLDKVESGLAQVIVQIPNDRKILKKIEIKGQIRHLSIVMKKIVINEETASLVAFHDIDAELDQQEIESWQKLIRVMTHEIKNSVIPISTLSQVINTMLNEEGVIDQPLSVLNEEDQEDLRLGIRTIEKRSKGLVKFVMSYNDLSKVPVPDLETIDLVGMLDDILRLENEEFSRHGITVIKNLPKQAVHFPIDLQMIEQVLINLIKNAIEALEGEAKGELQIGLQTSRDEVIIRLIDNGPGMDQETLSNIFVPFYTTKEQGSGIGLSLSRQIIRAHRGQLKIYSTPGQGTKVEMIFRK
ncbi:MAG: two-component system nitrogen regulation sensor histidine kinase NtrY [Paraglaciecola sp.]|jgi:two-component system nitrogen regulation sensor histidine kinase NtrY